MTPGDSPADSYVLGTEPEEELIRQGHGSAEEAAAAAAAMARARLDPGAYWVGPTVLALRARRGQHP
ncbi:hypothetical protein [Synechococcus sp. FACHB-909]|uniref:hypothetical protein n=1 Tax=Synechococcus sp. FACHB-909 TaxID=2692863 RepID=UPI001688E364|nr:hypothetical protein [Synechococcus sp. FACHB-909]MBD2718248.1 hypothetical protein [Synechococcus sp. FACHB-909]